MSNLRRLKRGLAASGVAHPQSQPPPADFAAVRSIAGAKHGRGTPMVAGGGGPSYGSVVARRLQGVGPYRRTMAAPSDSRKHGSKPGQRGGVNRAHGKAKTGRR